MENMEVYDSIIEYAEAIKSFDKKEIRRLRKQIVEDILFDLQDVSIEDVRLKIENSFNSTDNVTLKQIFNGLNKNKINTFEDILSGIDSEEELNKLVKLENIIKDKKFNKEIKNLLQSIYPDQFGNFLKNAKNSLTYNNGEVFDKNVYDLFKTIGIVKPGNKNTINLNFAFTSLFISQSNIDFNSNSNEEEYFNNILDYLFPNKTISFLYNGEQRNIRINSIEYLNKLISSVDSKSEEIKNNIRKTYNIKESVDTRLFKKLEENNSINNVLNIKPEDYNKYIVIDLKSDSQKSFIISSLDRYVNFINTSEKTEFFKIRVTKFKANPAVINTAIYECATAIMVSSNNTNTVESLVKAIIGTDYDTDEIKKEQARYALDIFMPTIKLTVEAINKHCKENNLKIIKAISRYNLENHILSENMVNLLLSSFVEKNKISPADIVVKCSDINGKIKYLPISLKKFNKDTEAAYLMSAEEKRLKYTDINKIKFVLRKNKDVNATTKHIDVYYLKNDGWELDDLYLSVRTNPLKFEAVYNKHTGMDARGGKYNIKDDTFIYRDDLTGIICSNIAEDKEILENDIKLKQALFSIYKRAIFVDNDYIKEYLTKIKTGKIKALSIDKENIINDFESLILNYFEVRKLK